MNNQCAIILAWLAAVGCGACESTSDSKAGGFKKDTIGPGTAVCNLNTSNPGPLVRGGLARIQIDGPGVDIDAKNVPALCGPIYNVDIPKLNAKAGDGLLLETCLPEGTLQVTSYKRVPGKQPLHSSSEQGGTEVAFNKNQGSTFTSRGADSDSIVLSNDMWKAEIAAELVDVTGSDKLEAKITFDCPNPSPLELKTAKEQAEAAAAGNAPTPPAGAAPSAEGPTRAPVEPAPPK